MRTALGALALAALLAGCVRVPPLDPLPKRRVVLRDVAYTPQEADDDCGVACLTTVLRYRGAGLDRATVSAGLKRAASGGVLPLEMLFFARKNGYHVALDNASINALRRRLLQGAPAVLLVHPEPTWLRWLFGGTGHYVVAVGYDDDEREVVLHTGDDAFDTMSYRTLQLEWGRSNFLAVFVGPRTVEQAGRPGPAGAPDPPGCPPCALATPPTSR